MTTKSKAALASNVTTLPVKPRKSAAEPKPKATPGRRSKAAAPKADLMDAVRTEAYLIWVAEGQPHGRDLAHWEEAERRVRARL